MICNSDLVEKKKLLRRLKACPIVYAPTYRNYLEVLFGSEFFEAEIHHRYGFPNHILEQKYLQWLDPPPHLLHLAITHDYNPDYFSPRDIAEEKQRICTPLPPLLQAQSHLGDKNEFESLTSQLKA